jgi:hypothetical protein
MDTTRTTEGSTWEAWGKGAGAIYGSRLQDIGRVLPRLGPPEGKDLCLAYLDWYGVDYNGGEYKRWA